MSGTERNPILLFDGPCNLCQGTVKFVLPRDRKGRIRFASLQSEVAQELLNPSGPRVAAEDPSATESSPDGASSVVFIDDKGTHRRSTAALRVVRHLGLPWSLLYVFIIVPAPLRDAVYDFVARHRYRWFGRSESCMVPAKSVEDRFLDAGENLVTTPESP